MGFWNDIGDSIKKGFREGAAKGIIHASGYNASTGDVRDAAYQYDAAGNITGINAEYASKIADLYTRSSGNGDVVTGLGSSTSVKIDGTGNTANFKKWSGEGAGGPQAKYVYDNLPEKYNNKTSDLYKLKLPDWGYDDFINERAIWQKGLSSMFDEPGWFYFKVFFDFDTTNGLLGGLLNMSQPLKGGNNTAITYLNSCLSMYKKEKIGDRMEALHKFGAILSYITTNAPWYFKAVKGLDKASLPVITDFTSERSIELDLNSEAIDMRLSTLMSLYQYACFDTFHGKEIIPRNLRLFNMSVIIFQTPLRYLHTSYVSNKKTVTPALKNKTINKYAEKWNLDALKTLNNETLSANVQGKVKKNYKRMTHLNSGRTNFSDMMSMKIYTFEGCEFDPASFAAIIPGTMSNEQPFKMGESSLKITYTRCIEHTMNEFYAMMFGTDGFYFNNYAMYQLYGSYNDYYHKSWGLWDKQLERYQTLAETLEDVARGGSSFGIDSVRTYQKAVDATEAVMNGVLAENDVFSKIGANFLLKAIKTSYSVDAGQGNLYGNYGINSDYFKDQLDKLKNGVHDHTTKPFDYSKVDPVSYERDKEIDNKNTRRDQKLIDGLGENASHQYTTEPYVYDNLDYFKQQAEKLKNGTHARTTKPFDYSKVDPIQYEREKDTGYNAKRTHQLIDGYKGNPEHQYTTEPYEYDPNLDYNLQNWLNKLKPKNS